MQATLLGIAVAIILALLAALVGPLFVDWGQYREYFEAEATKLVGQPVRITGAIDARILPTPSVTLGNVEITAAGKSQVRAREVHVELALGQLVRGEFRASELTIAGPDVALGIGADGRVDLPVARLGFDPDRLQIERIEIEDGRVALADRTSGSEIELRGFYFKGDVRSLLGPAKGEGGFMAAGERYGYRFAASRAGDDGVVKIKLGLDPVDQPVTVETEGALSFVEREPRYEGTLSLARPAAIARQSGRGQAATPWRVSAKIKASAARALFEQLEYQYGPDERAIRLNGTAELRLGKAPALDAVLSARNVDLDRALALPEASRRLPLAALKAAVVALFASSYRPGPCRCEIGIGCRCRHARDGGPCPKRSWRSRVRGRRMEHRDARVSRARLRTGPPVGGRVAAAADGLTFSGPAQIEASDPKLFLSWLEGRTDTTQSSARGSYARAAI